MTIDKLFAYPTLNSTALSGGNGSNGSGHLSSNINNINNNNNSSICSNSTASQLLLGSQASGSFSSSCALSNLTFSSNASASSSSNCNVNVNISSNSNSVTMSASAASMPLAPLSMSSAGGHHRKVPPNDFDIHSQVNLRFLCPDDIYELKTLCSEWFPVDYPDSWYSDITSSTRFYSLAATSQGRIVGMIVAEIRLKKTTDKEDWHILSNKHSDQTQITYILSLGVFKEFRRLGIASLLLDTLLTYLKTETDCKAVYLHVLCSNAVAISFYEKRNFQQRIYLPSYYTIKGQLQDGFCYVLYMNNGEPPWTLSDCLLFSWSLVKTYNPCKLTCKLAKLLNDCFKNTLLVYRNYVVAKDFYRIS